MFVAGLAPGAHEQVRRPAARTAAAAAAGYHCPCVHFLNGMHTLYPARPVCVNFGCSALHGCGVHLSSRSSAPSCHLVGRSIGPCCWLKRRNSASYQALVACQAPPNSPHLKNTHQFPTPGQLVPCNTAVPISRQQRPKHLPATTVPSSAPHAPHTVTRPSEFRQRHMLRPPASPGPTASALPRPALCLPAKVLLPLRANHSVLAYHVLHLCCACVLVLHTDGSVGSCRQDMLGSTLRIWLQPSTLRLCMYACGFTALRCFCFKSAARPHMQAVPGGSSLRPPTKCPSRLQQPQHATHPARQGQLPQPQPHVCGACVCSRRTTSNAHRRPCPSSTPCTAASHCVPHPATHSSAPSRQHS
jgi:hypothetical protein